MRFSLIHSPAARIYVLAYVVNVGRGLLMSLLTAQQLRELASSIKPCENTFPVVDM
jgi:hypothetical protein